MVSLVVLLLCFAVAACCTFLIITTLQMKRRKAVAHQNAANTITPDRSSTNSTIKMKHAKQSPQSGQSSHRGSPQHGTPFTLNYGTANPVNLENSETKDSGAVIFVDSSSNQNQGVGSSNEATPLLRNEDATSLAAAGDFEFGTLSEASGLWHRDLAGRHIVKFVILLLLLVFSSLVVNLRAT